MPENENACSICSAPDNGFRILNGETSCYSGLEIAVNRQGMLRARCYLASGTSPDQDIVNVPFCPLCGRKFK